MSKGSVLLLATCSNHKLYGGSPDYSDRASILSLLPSDPSLSRRFLERRRRILRLILSEEIKVNGMPLASAPYNTRLTSGLDMGEEGSGLYMPAIERYQGRFYRELGVDRYRRVVGSRHHTLILSGLYGLLTPREQIQCYSCHVLHDPRIEHAWASRGGVTSLLLAYASAFGIQWLIDLTGEDAYRRLVDWRRVASKVQVFHAFGEQNAGPDVLPALGQLAWEWLVDDDEDQLLTLDTGQTFSTDYERVLLTTDSEPPEGFPREERVAPPPTPPQKPVEIHRVKVEMSSEPRGIPVRSPSTHNTMFGKPIARIEDLPGELQEQVRKISRIVHVIDVRLQGMRQGAGRSTFDISPRPPQLGTGIVHGRITGPGAVCHSQDIAIGTTPGREEVVYQAILTLKKHPAESDT